MLSCQHSTQLDGMSRLREIKVQYKNSMGNIILPTSNPWREMANIYIPTFLYQQVHGHLYVCCGSYIQGAKDLIWKSTCQKMGHFPIFLTLSMGLWRFGLYNIEWQGPTRQLMHPSHSYLTCVRPLSTFFTWRIQFSIRLEAFPIPSTYDSKTVLRVKSPSRLLFIYKKIGLAAIIV